MANPTGSSKWKSIPWNQWPGASPTTTPNSCCGTHPSATTPTSFPYSPGHYRASPLVIPARDRCVMRQKHNRAGTQQVKKCPLRYGWSRRTVLRRLRALSWNATCAGLSEPGHSNQHNTTTHRPHKPPRPSPPTTPPTPREPDMTSSMTLVSIKLSVGRVVR